MSSRKTTFLLCLHTQGSTNTSTTPQQSPSRLSRMFSTGSRRAESRRRSDSFIDGLCPKCMSVFRSENIEQAEARLRVLEYRMMYRYTGRLRPVVAGSLGGNMVLISQDDPPTLDYPPAGQPGFKIPRKPVPNQEPSEGFWSIFKRKGAGTLSESEKVYLDHLESWWFTERNGDRRQEISFSTSTESGSTVTIWPSFGRVSGEFDSYRENPPTPGPSRSSRPARPMPQEEADLGSQSLSNSYHSVDRRSVDRYFVIADTRPESSISFTGQVAGSRSSDQSTYPFTRRNVEPSWQSSPASVDRGSRSQALYALTGEVPPSDLDKPLPPIPRPDTPVPGAPFDSNVPDRDLPRSRYYRRVI